MLALFKILANSFREYPKFAELAVMQWPGDSGVMLRNWYLKSRLKSMGRDCFLMERIRLINKDRISFDDFVGISPDVQINGTAGVSIGDHTLIGPGAKIWTINHRFDDLSKPIRLQGWSEAAVTIEENVWIAANAIILPGVRLGQGSIIAAGAVVTRDVLPFQIVAGIPAKVIGNRKDKNSADSIMPSASGL